MKNKGEIIIVPGSYNVIWQFSPPAPLFRVIIGRRVGLTAGLQEGVLSFIRRDKGKKFRAPSYIPNLGMKIFTYCSAPATNSEFQAVHGYGNQLAISQWLNSINEHTCRLEFRYRGRCEPIGVEELGKKLVGRFGRSSIFRQRRFGSKDGAEMPSGDLRLQ